MKRKILSLLTATSCLVAPLAVAQEHVAQGPVWVLSCYQVNDGHWDDYMKWLRTHNLPLQEARKKAGLILDYKMFLSQREGPEGCDLIFADLYPSAAAAFDYSAEDDARMDEIGKAHWEQWDEAARTQAQGSRFPMRRFIRSNWIREVSLKPMQ